MCHLREVFTVTSYEYNLLDKILLPISITTTNSSGEVHKQATTYSGLGTTSIAQNLSQRNIIYIPLVSKSYVDNSVVNGTKIDYSYFDANGNPGASVSYGFPRPHKSYTYNVTWDQNGTRQDNGWVLQNTIQNYDYGMPSSLRKKGDAYSSILTYNWRHQITSKKFGNLETKYKYYSNGLLLEKITNPDGTFTSYEYDSGLRLKKTTHNATATTVDYSYHYASSSPYANYTKKVIAYGSGAYPDDTNSALRKKTYWFYVDGLGRPLQTIESQSAPNGKDLILSSTQYDNRGAVRYSFAQRASSYSGGQFIQPVNTWQKTSFTYYPSPLHRLKTTTPPSWYASTQYYEGNSGSDAIYNHSSSTFYSTNALIKSRHRNPNGQNTITFTDKLGRTILTRITNSNQSSSSFRDTYYLYDNKNRLTQVIPPGSTKDDPHLNFYYFYDGEDKVISKKAPSKGMMTYVYNHRDLLVGQQDAMLATQNKWMATTYDGYKRPLTSGIITSTGPPSLNNSGNPTISSSYQLTKNTYHPTSTSGILRDKLQKSSVRILGSTAWLNQSYEYDSAGRIKKISGNNHLSPTRNNDHISYRYARDGSVTLTNTNVDVSSTNHNNIDEVTTINSKGRAETIKHKLDTSPGWRTLATLEYNNKDELLREYIGGDASSHLQKIDYSYLPSGILSTVNGGSATGSDIYGFKLYYDNAPTTAGYSLGTTPTIKKNGLINSIQWAQKGADVDLTLYKYDYLDRLISSHTPDQLYNSSYAYDQRGNFNSIKRYADISGTKTLIDHLDPMVASNNANLLLQMQDLSGHAMGFDDQTNANYTYDLNGNLTSDPQKGISSITYNHLDLTDQITWSDGRKIDFIYTADGSLLTKKVYTAGGTLDHTYDYVGPIEYLDGEIIKVNHAYGSIAYRPSVYPSLTLSATETTNQTYTAEQITSISTIQTGHTHYKATDHIWLNTAFKVDAGATFRAEILPQTTATSWVDQWDVRDHLGNLRMVYADLDDSGTITTDEILQSEQYYPYGLKRKSSDITIYDQQYQYNGIDHVVDNDLGLHMATYRSLDPALGIWLGVDPKAEALYGLSPYQAMGNNPISFADPEGDFIAEVLIGAGIGVVSNGISNLANDGSFFDGWAKAALFGALGGAISFGIGNVAGLLSNAGVSNLGVASFQVAAHSFSGGVMSELQGGSFASGALSGGVSSGLSSGASALGFSPLEMIGVGALSGGISSSLSGGDFWKGAGQGLITSGLNHAAHSMIGNEGPGDPPTKEELKVYLAGEFLDGRISRKEYLNAIALVDDGPWGLFKNVVSNNKYDIAMTVVPVGRLGMLGRYFASLEHLSQPGKMIIKNLRSGPRLAKQYGGNASDWVKMTSTTYNGSGGFKFSTHWYQNVSTGARVEYKTVFGR